MSEHRKNSKYFSVIVVPHGEGESRNYRIPLWLCQAACLAIVIFFAALFTLVYYYRDLNTVAEENVLLREEVQAKKAELEEVTRDTRKLGEKSSEIESQIENVAEILEVDPPETEFPELDLGHDFTDE